MCFIILKHIIIILIYLIWIHLSQWATYERKWNTVLVPKSSMTWIRNRSGLVFLCSHPLPLLLSWLPVFISPSLPITLHPDYFSAGPVSWVTWASLFFSLAFCMLWFRLWPLGRLVGYFWSLVRDQRRSQRWERRSEWVRVVGNVQAQYDWVFAAQPQHPAPSGREMIGSECLGSK